ncbi:hypothetical protein MTBBW1_1670006 [Desulfamplus magnetovallimortis]|uniref:Uncharacterized protein n=1 Tax=Desulfamplus magnetovallimortis TaxID=1246637 RepID=A0A1W1H917_9BACT|nr:hypothetical protein [Desulfamplus magnetovallimortis]SLM28990.1 hypothetical protein MTBBW1_1670006 [Desulfamplus magnetovallimortis]
MTEAKQFIQNYTVPIAMFFIFSSILAYLVHLAFQSGGWMYLLLLIAIIPANIVYRLVKVLFCGQKLIIENNKIIRIKHRFEEEHSGEIAKTLSEIVLYKDGDIRSYRFKFDDEENMMIQVSPAVYKQREELERILEPFVLNGDIPVRDDFWR